MILLDTNIIIDLLSTDASAPSDWSRRRYAIAVDRDVVGCNHVILAEVAARATDLNELLNDFGRFRIEMVDFTDEAAFAAGRAHRAYRDRGGERRAILADFLIAGHAEALGASLMTRDRRLAGYFPDLTLITPETHP